MDENAPEDGEEDDDEQAKSSESARKVIRYRLTKLGFAKAYAEGDDGTTDEEEEVTPTEEDDEYHLSETTDKDDDEEDEKRDKINQLNRATTTRHILIRRSCTTKLTCPSTTTLDSHCIN